MRRTWPIEKGDASPCTLSVHTRPLHVLKKKACTLKKFISPTSFLLPEFLSLLRFSSEEGFPGMPFRTTLRENILECWRRCSAALNYENKSLQFPEKESPELASHSTQATKISNFTKHPIRAPCLGKEETFTN